jgi:hypothetical protein
MQALKLIGTDRAECPVCGRSCSVRSKSAEGSGFWAHYFGKRCRSLRLQSDKSYPDHNNIGLLIKQADNIGRKQLEATMEKQKLQERAEKRERHDRVHRKHSVTGGFLLDVINELQGALDMMEPYYSQCGAGADGRAMISKIEEIVSQVTTKQVRTTT